MRRLPTLLAISLTSTACSGVDSDLPAAYRRLDVPESRLGSREAVARGRDLHATYCALCHGERGDGRGARSTGLTNAPADFTDPAWRDRTSARRIFFAVREGVRGTAMPAWKGTLDDDETWDIVAFILSLTEPRHSTDRRLDRNMEHQDGESTSQVQVAEASPLT